MPQSLPKGLERIPRGATNIIFSFNQTMGNMVSTLHSELTSTVAIQISLSLSKLWLSGILRIVFASNGRKVALMTSALHHFMAGSMREETMGKVRRLLGGVMTLCVVRAGSHLSSHM